MQRALVALLLVGSSTCIVLHDWQQHWQRHPCTLRSLVSFEAVVCIPGLVWNAAAYVLSCLIHEFCVLAEHVLPVAVVLTPVEQHGGLTS